MHTPETKELIDSCLNKLFEQAKHNADINRKLVDYPARIKTDDNEYDLILVDILKPVYVFLQANPVDLPIIQSVADNWSEFKIGKVLMTDGYSPLESMAISGEEEPEDYQFDDELEKIDFEESKEFHKMFFDEAKKSQMIIYITTIEPYGSCKGLVEIPEPNNSAASETEKIISDLIISKLNYKKFVPSLHDPEGNISQTYSSLTKEERDSISDMRPLVCAYPYDHQEPQEIYTQTKEILKIVSDNSPMFSNFGF